ncbi:hypothetical protein DRQ33_08390, partial [bacterium]
IFVCDLEAKALFLNNVARKKLGLKDKEKISGVNLFDFIHPQDLFVAKKMFQGKIDGEFNKTLYNIRIKLADGEYRHFQINSIIVKKDGKPFVVQGIARDITDLLEIEQELVERSREINILNEFSDVSMRNITDSSIIMQKGLDYSMKLAGFDAGAIYKVDYENRKIIGVYFRGFSKQDSSTVNREMDIDPEAQWFQTLIQDEVKYISNPQDFDLPILTYYENEKFDNFVVALAVQSGIPYAIICLCNRSKSKISKDKLHSIKALVRHLVTALAQATAHHELVESRDSLRTANQLWAGTFDTIKDTILITDREGEILRVNEASGRILNIPADELVGKNIFEYALQWCAKCEQIFPKVLSTGKSFDFEIRMPITGKYLMVTMSPIYRGSDINGALLIIRDITEIRQMWEQIAQNQKMESVGFLASGVAHNFNNILMSITGNLYQLENLLENNYTGAVKDTIQSIECAVEDATDTIRQLLNFARTHKTEKCKFESSELVKETQFLSKAFPPNIHIDISSKIDNCWVLGDPQQLKQAIVNLILNAKDAMPDGGTIKVEIDKKKITEEDAHNIKAGEYVIIAVEDEGIGIAEENLSKIFDPFFTTKDPDKGTGLGLSLVYNYVTSMGGDISVNSVENQGTRFEIILPSVSPPKLAYEKSERKTSANVLLVEDDDTLHNLFANFLDKQGYEVNAVKSAGEALKCVESFKPDVAVLDIFLPDEAEDNLVWAIIKRCPRTPVLLISGSKVNSSMMKMLERGKGAFLLKPFKLDELDEIIQSLLERKQKSSRWN